MMSLRTRYLQSRRLQVELPSDTNNRFAEVFVGMNNRSSAQTLMVRPVSTTTLTFDGKPEKLEFFEDLFHTMIKMQPDRIEAMKISRFHVCNAKMLFKLSAIPIRQIVRHWRTSWPYFVGNTFNPESQATAKHKWNGTDWCLTQTQ